MYKESFKNLNDVLLKNNKKDNKKIESMKRIIHKVVAKEASDNWRKHIPVYGWTTMNYPSTIQPSLVQKYKKIHFLDPNKWATSVYTFDL